MLWRLTNFWGKANFRRSRPGNRFLQLFKNKFKKIFLSTLHHLTLPGERESYREVRLRNWAEFGTSFFKSRTVRLIWKKYSSWVQTDLLSFGQTQPRWCNLTSCQLSHSPPSHLKEKGCSLQLPLVLDHGYSWGHSLLGPRCEGQLFPFLFWVPSSSSFLASYASG